MSILSEELRRNSPFQLAEEAANEIEGLELKIDDLNSQLEKAGFVLIECDVALGMLSNAKVVNDLRCRIAEIKPIN